MSRSSTPPNLTNAPQETSPLAADDERDAQLAAILTEATCPTSGPPASLEQVVAQHPQFADELRQLWGAVMVVDAVAAHREGEFDEAAPHTGSTIDRGQVAFASVAASPPRRLGEFDLVEEIGRGGMGVVYRARQPRLGREVAVKVMLRGAAASRSDRERFQAEASAAARLDHPGIVPVYGAGETDGWRYFGMKLIPGRTLAQRLADGPLPPREAARIVMEAARAIDYAHQRGVVHRDLKPANILLDPEGGVHVSDFGLAKQEAAPQSLTVSGAILGTPLYMAPEQAGGRGPVGPACDVYSLGAVLYALLAGRPPFVGESPMATLLQLVEQEPPTPRELNPRLSRDLEMIVLRAIQKPPDLRYRSAAALADDLASFLAGEPVAARSGRITQVAARLFGETHHAAVLENWGLLWMWHAVVLLVLCGATDWLHRQRLIRPLLQSPWPYALLWGGGLAIWAPIFWAVRRRSGPVTAVERQVAHAWGGSIVAVVLLFAVEALLGLEVLTLSPVLGLVSGMTFVVKAGILSGVFYLQAAALFLCGVTMAWMRQLGCDWGVTLFGLVCGAAFFIPGWKYFGDARARAARLTLLGKSRD